MPQTNPWAKIAAYADKPERLLIGLMSGTSVDGVDAALVRVSGTGRATRADLVAFVTHPFPSDLRERVLDVSHGRGNAETVSRLSVDLGHLFADAARAVLETANVPPADVDAIASHGQTVSHTVSPSAGSSAAQAAVSASAAQAAVSASAAQAAVTASSARGATLQIGDASVIAQALGVPVVSDFRTADVALGGQGAPLVPYADWCLLTHPTRTRCVQNIGGIGNVTFLPADAKPEQVPGFDTGPGNMLIDRAVQHVTKGKLQYDENGWLAEQGLKWWAADRKTPLWDFLMAHSFLAQAPPKSAGREEFGGAFFDEILRRGGPRGACTDGGGGLTAFVATMTAYTAYSIADAYTRFLPSLPDEVIVGGGTKNPILMGMLAGLLAPIPVLTHDDLGMNSDSKEAVAFVVLANETLLGNPSNLPSVTGASRSAVLGKVTLP